MELWDNAFLDSPAQGMILAFSFFEISFIGSEEPGNFSDFRYKLRVWWAIPLHTS